MNLQANESQVINIEQNLLTSLIYSVNICLLFTIYCVLFFCLMSRLDCPSIAHFGTVLQFYIFVVTLFIVDSLLLHCCIVALLHCCIVALLHCVVLKWCAMVYCCVVLYLRGCCIMYYSCRFHIVAFVIQSFHEHYVMAASEL